MVYNKTFNVLVSDYKYGSFTLYIVLFVAILAIAVIIGSVFICLLVFRKISQNFIASINEDYQTSHYKKSSKLFF